MTSTVNKINVKYLRTLNPKVSVYKEEPMLIAHIGKPELDTFFNNNFRAVKFVKADNSLLKNSIFDGRVFNELEESGDLVEGNVVNIKYETGSGWIDTINGKDWH